MVNGKLLKKLRTYKGYHQKEIAEALDVCQQYISKLENSRKIVEEGKFQKIRKAMEVSDAEWERIKDMFTPPPAK
jgi:transcriptional regulator with XRE-family HTH domain